MSAIVVSTEVERPAAEVFAYATDPTCFSEWQRGVVSGHMDQPDPSLTPIVGTRCLTTRRIGGANRAVTSEVTHVDPPRTWGPGTTDLATLKERSRLDRGRDRGLTAGPDEMPGNLATLKERVEARPGL